MAGEVFCRVDAAFVKERTTTGMEAALRKNLTGIPEVDDIVTCLARHRLACAKKQKE